MGGIESYIKVVDNSGVKAVKCVKILTVGKKNDTKLGGYFIVAINKGNKKKKFRYKKIILGLILLKKNYKFRPSGYYIKSAESRCILLHDKEQMVGNRFKGPVSIEAKLNNDTKAMQYAKVSL
jgi:large subunit ribosomal protein L14